MPTAMVIMRPFFGSSKREISYIFSKTVRVKGFGPADFRLSLAGALC